MVFLFFVALHPRRLRWNLRIDHWKGKSSSKASFSGFFVNLRGCMFFVLFWIWLAHSRPAGFV